MKSKIVKHENLIYKKLLKLVKKEGVLVEKMEQGEDFSIDRPNIEYKKCLGTVPVYSFFKKKIKNVYVIYEDFDGTVKYYDYPQNLIYKKLLKLVKKEGVLVEKMDKGEDFRIDRPNVKYKKCLGTTAAYSFFKKKIKNVYVIYEDFDGTVKYYDYPQ